MGESLTNLGCFSLIWGSFYVKLVFWESARPGRIFGPSRPGPGEFSAQVGPARRNFRPKSARPGGIFGPSRPGPEKFSAKSARPGGIFRPSRPGPARSKMAEISNTAREFGFTHYITKLMSKKKITQNKLGDHFFGVLLRLES